MTDTTQPREEITVCRSCGNAFASKYLDKHKRACGAVLANRLDAYQQRHGGDHIALDEHLQKIDATLTTHNSDVTRIDTDYNAIFERVTALEDSNPGSAAIAPPGITVSGYSDTDDDITDDPEDPTTPATTSGPIGPYSPTL